MRKVVLKLDIHDGKCKQRAMKMVSGTPGLESISVDMKEKKMTITGDVDPVAVVSKLRKVYHAEIVSVGPAKEPEKKKEEPKKKDEPKKEEAKKKEEPKNQAQVVQVHEFLNHKAYQAYPQYLYPRHYYVTSVEEDPTSCVIC